MRTVTYLYAAQDARVEIEYFNKEKDGFYVLTIEHGESAIKIFDIDSIKDKLTKEFSKIQEV